MIATDENALICDFAETYNVYDYKSLPVFLVATLAVGLRENSRIKMKMTGAKVTHEMLVLSLIADRIGTLGWLFSEDGQKGINRPASILEIIYGDEIRESQSDVLTFSSPEDYEKARREIMKKGGK